MTDEELVKQLSDCARNPRRYYVSTDTAREAAERIAALSTHQPVSSGETMKQVVDELVEEGRAKKDSLNDEQRAAK